MPGDGRLGTQAPVLPHRRLLPGAGGRQARQLRCRGQGRHRNARDQLYRYRQVVEEDHLEEDEILLVYFKTGFVYPDERALAKKAGFTVFDLDDLQQFLCRDPMEKDHEILRQYRDRVQRIAAERERALQDWDWSQGFVQFDFMSRLRKVLAERRREWSTLTGDRNSSDLP